ncbi:MAG: CDP-diacylglycerol--glycerol-3-phosphate 3-phosphatidyltransferase [Alphaproteobacteria bacterium]
MAMSTERPKKMNAAMSIPNLLTLSRIATVPLLVAAFFLPGIWAYWLPCALFALAGVTDFLDGYLARAWGQQSNLGRFLDPVADKLLVASALMMLIAFDRLSELAVLPAIVILCREIMVSGLREFLAELRVGLPVSRLAKWKTAIQIVAVGVLLAGDAGSDLLAAVSLPLPVPLIGEIGLWAAALLTLVTGYDYLRSGLHHMRAGTADARPDRAAE